MDVAGSMSGMETPTRKFRIGATLVANQVVVRDGTGVGEVTDPNANTYYQTVGVTFEAGTYAATSPGVTVKCSYGPDQLLRAKAAGGTTADTALSGTSSASGTLIIPQTSASTTVITGAATDIFTLDYIGGYMVALDGSAKGDVRTVGTQVDNTTITNSVPFSASIAVGNTVFRTYGAFVQGVELTSDFCQWNVLLTTGEVFDTVAMGPVAVWDVIFDGHSIVGVTKTTVVNPTSPQVDLICGLLDSAFTYQS